MGINIGYLHFTDPEHSQKGIAALQGQPVKHIENIGELATSTKWMTNLETTLPGQSNAHHGLYLQNKYLRITPDKILTSLNAHHAGPEKQASVMASILANITSLGDAVFGIDRLDPYEYRRNVRQMFLPDDMCLSNDLYRMVIDSTQYYTFCGQKTDPKKRIVFYLPKISHGKKVLQTALPEGTWTAVKDLPFYTEEIVEWMKKRERPFFAKVTLSHFDPKWQSLISFGRSCIPKDSERQWVTNVELEMLLGKAEIEIKEVWEATGTLASLKVIDTVQGLMVTGELGISIGLLVENIWSGLMLDSPPGRRQKKNNTNMYKNIVGPFLRAADKRLCFEKAMALQESGFTVASYGHGKIIVDTSFHDDEEIIKAALDIELLPPYCPQLELTPSTEDPFLFALQAYYASGDTETLLDLDQAVTNKILEDYHAAIEN